ncbi:VIT1/CCC1 transporter family protein [Patescibacteria group bacterium]
MPKYIHHELNEVPSLRKKFFSSLREVIFGLEDGIVSTLGAITGIAGGIQDSDVVILAGFVIIVVESMSMAAGTFLSSKSEAEVNQRMLNEEREEIEKEPAKEREEIIKFYKERGFSDKETKILVKRITGNKELMLEEMAYRELRIIPSKNGTPKNDAVFMGISYIIGGIIPLSAYFYLPLVYAIVVSVASSVLILFIIGYSKGKMVHVNKLRSGAEMVLVSLTAAGIGYAVGRIIERFI